MNKYLKIAIAAVYILAILNVAHLGSKNPKAALIALMVVGAVDWVCLLIWVMLFGDRHLPESIDGGS